MIQASLLSAGKKVIELLEELVSSLRSAMNDWIIVTEFNWDVFALEELLEVLPVVNFLIELKAVVILVHLDLLGVVPAS